MFPILFIINLIGFSILGLLLYIIYLPFKIHFKRSGKLSTKASRTINVVYFYSIILAVLGFTYYQAEPPESFYEEEFKTITLRDIPESAEFISKEASYPDFHGDYCSSARIQLSKKDYQKLLTEIDNNPALTVSEEDFGGFEESQQIPGKRPLKSFDRKITGEEDEYYNIQFYEGNIVVINICIT
jgi:hypothetical protein